MLPLRKLVVCSGLGLLLGCRSALSPAPSPVPPTVAAAPPAPMATEAEFRPAAASGPVRLASVEEVPPPEAGALELDWLVAEVEARNPSLQALVFAWQSAAHRYPQAISLEDPMFMGMVAPDSIDSPTVSTGYTIEVGQKLPWFGKRALRGERAMAQADMAAANAEDYRQRLIELTQTAYFDYFLAYRQRALNRHNVELMSQFRQTAQTRYRANQVTEQDVFQADVELADFERKEIEYERMQRVAVARINTLLRHPPDALLPPPVESLPTSARPAEPEILRQIALVQRPDLAAAAAEIREAEAAVTLADKDFHPDLEVFGRYDAFWQESELRGAVGLRLNMPIYRARLQAAYCEAVMRLNQRRAEFEQELLDVGYEVQIAYDQVEESRKTLDLYASRYLPLAERYLAAARANYEAGKGTFLELLVAQRRLVEAQQGEQEAIATFNARAAALSRAVGASQFEFLPRD